jgi:hypothetical protein
MTPHPKLRAGAMIVRMIGASSWFRVDSTLISRTKDWPIFSVVTVARHGED